MKVLFIGNCFPRPTNPSLGVWALGQMQAFVRQCIELEILSFNPYVPKCLAFTPGARRFAECPPQHTWDNVTAHYENWLYYPVGPLRKIQEKYVSTSCAIVWQSSKRILMKTVESFRPDVIYAHHSIPNGYLAYCLHKKYGIPYVVTDHDFDEIRCCERNASRRRTVGLIAAHAAAMICVSKRMQNDMERIFPTARVQTVQNGTIPVPKGCLAAPRPAELKDKRVILSVGGFFERKGFPLLVEAFASVARRFSDVVLRIVGDGQTRPQIESVIAEKQLQDRVTLLGSQPHDHVLQEMAWCDFFALIGWDEPFATVFTEAMSVGKPLLCANDGGINDVVANGIHGRMIPPHDIAAASNAMLDMLSHPAELAAMGRAAAKLVEEQLTWDANARKMLRLFEMIIK